MKVAIKATTLLFVTVANADETGNVTVPITPLSTFLIAAQQDDLRNDTSTVTGTWVSEDKAHPGDRPPDALNVSRIECYPSMHLCVESSAAVRENRFLAAATAMWEVTEVVKTKITATVAGLCSTNTLTINLATREVTNVALNGGYGDWALCTKKQKWPDGTEHAMFTPYEHPIVWKMVSGREAMEVDDRFHH